MCLVCEKFRMCCLFFFFFNDTATTEIYTLSLHDALPISPTRSRPVSWRAKERWPAPSDNRSEEHTSELQSLRHLVCRLLLEKKKQPQILKSTKRNNKKTANKYIKKPAQ